MSRRCTWNGGWWAHARRSPSPNAGPRPAGAAIDLVVLHSISLPPGEFGGPEVEEFFHNRLDASAHPYFAQLQDLKVSAHFFVRRTGQVLQFVSCDQRAWHAGVSAWRGRSQCNDFSIGIELEGLDDGTVFCASQYAALSRLLRAVSRAYPVREVVGHEHVAPGRKADPGAGFDWRRLGRLLAPALVMPDAVRHKVA